MEGNKRNEGGWRCGTPTQHHTGISYFTLPIYIGAQHALWKDKTALSVPSSFFTIDVLRCVCKINRLRCIVTEKERVQRKERDTSKYRYTQVDMGEGYSKSHWVKDETAKNCKACRSEFSLTKRRHHCRNCGYIFCGQCSFRLQPVPQRGIETSVRVCDECYYSLLASDKAPPLAATQSRYGGSRENSFSSKAQANYVGGEQHHAADAPAPNSPTLGRGNTTADPSRSAQQPTSTSASDFVQTSVVPAKSKEQLRAERLSEVMEVIRRDLVHYVDASLVAVDPMMIDETPSWAPDQIYNLEVVTRDTNLMPFPAGVANSVGLLLAAPVKEPTLNSSCHAAEIERVIQSILAVEG